jgi:hypothetical protein
MLRSIPLLSAAAAASLTAAASAQSFNYPDFSSIANLSLVERAAQLGNVMRVHDTAGTGGNNRGAIWYDQPMNVVGGFSTTFEFQITGAGSGDGMAFVIQNESIAGTHGGVGVTGIGRHAAACGYGMFTTSVAGESIENSIAIEIDTYTNGQWGDLNNNHISIHTGGTGDNETGEDHSIGRTGLLSTDLNDSQVHTLTVNYVPGTLEVLLDGVSVLTTAYDFNTGGTWVDSASAVGGLDLIGGTSAWVGITAASGGSVENHDVLSWSFTSGAPSSLFCSPANDHSGGQPVTLASSGAGAAGVYHLEATGGPSAEFGFFLVSAGANPTGLAVSQGLLCLSPPLGRYSTTAGPGLNSLGSFDAGGVFQSLAGGSATGSGFDVPAVLPNPPGGVITSGQTWHFQLWYRDGTASNFSDALSVTF